MASLTGILRALFGRSKTVAKTAAEGVADDVKDAVQEVGARAGDAVDTAVESVNQVVEQVSQAPAAVMNKSAPQGAGSGGLGGANVVHLDRIALSAPQSDRGEKAIEVVRAKGGAGAIAKGLRIYEYALAAGEAYGLRPDKELMLLSSLFSVLGGEGGNAARQFCLDNGMWPALAERVGAVVEGSGDEGGEAEGKLLALGRDAEQSNGVAEWLHSLTAREIAKRHAA